MPIRFQTH